MPRIRCHYMDCVFNENGYCDASAIEVDPDTGCLTYSQVRGDIRDGVWVDDEDDFDEGWDDAGYDEIDDESWLDEEF